MKSFITYDSESDFSIYNIPFGVAFIAEEYPTCVTRIGDTIVDLAMLYDAGYLDNLGLEENVFEAMVLNPFIELGKSVTVPVREHIQKLFLEGSDLSKDTDVQANAFFDLKDVQMMLPVHIPNYTDFIAR